MLLGIDASRADLSFAGVGRYSVEMVRHLLDHGQHRFRLYANGLSRPSWSDRPNVEWRDIPFSRLWTHVRLSAEMARRPPDLLFVPGHVLPPVRPRRSVVTIHDLGYLHYPDCHPASQRLYLRLATAWNARVASAVLVDSRATLADLVARHGVPTTKVTVVYPGVSERFTPQPAAVVAAARARYHLPADYLLFVGTLQPRKNLVRTMAAQAQVPGAPPLVLAGSPGWLGKPILAAAEEAGDRVRLLGPVPDEDLPALMTGAVGLLLPSLYEGFGIPALEAMACGTPAIVSATSSLPEVVGDAGLVVDPLSTDSIAAAIATLSQDVDLRRDLARRGLDRAAQFTWESAASQALAVMEDLRP